MDSFELDIAWAAGLFEGEGTFEIQKNSRTSCRAGISSTDLDVLERFHRIVGVGSIRLHKKANYHTSVKTAWYWRTRNREECITIILLFAPFLGKRRRAVADRCLEIMTREIPTRACENEKCGRSFVPARGMQGHQRFCSLRCQKAGQYVRAQARGAAWADGAEKWRKEKARKLQSRP